MIYRITGYLTISAIAEIEASSPEEALEKAQELSTPGLCHQCAGAGDSSEGTWQLNEFDDPPQDAVQYIEQDDLEQSWKVNKDGELEKLERTS